MYSKEECCGLATTAAAIVSTSDRYADSVVVAGGQSG